MARRDLNNLAFVNFRIGASKNFDMRKFADGLSTLKDREAQTILGQAARAAVGSGRGQLKTITPVGKDPSPKRRTGAPRPRLNQTIKTKVVKYKSGVVWAGLGYDARLAPHQNLVEGGTNQHDIQVKGKVTSATGTRPLMSLKAKPHDGGFFLGPAVIHDGAKPAESIDTVYRSIPDEVLAQRFDDKAMKALNKKIDSIIKKTLKTR